MSYLILRRPPRTPPPPVPGAQVQLADPPTRQQGQLQGALAWIQYLFPVVASAGALVYVLVNPQPLYFIGGGMFALAAVAMAFGMYFQQTGAQRRRLLLDRERYLRYLSDVRRGAAQTEVRQREAARWCHPPPPQLWAIARSRARAWERRPEDRDFLDVRIGLGTRPVATPLLLDAARRPLTDFDGVSLAAARRLLARHGRVEDLPLTLPLAHLPVVTVEGPVERCRSLARSLVSQLVAFHAPEDLKLVFGVAPGLERQWEWVKWLPHVEPGLGSRQRGQPGAWSRDLAALQDLLRRELETRRVEHLRRRGQGEVEYGAAATGGEQKEKEQRIAATGLPNLLVVIDGLQGASSLAELLGSPRPPGVSLVYLAPDEGPGQLAARVSVGADGSLAVSGERASGAGVADAVGVHACETLARLLAPLRLSADSTSRRLVETVALPELLAITDVRSLDAATAWAERPVNEQLRVPLGIRPDGEPLVLDVKEPALGGMGPHGLVVGATGSGKSELLRTLVTGLAATHSPELLSLVLVDFKGGATFARLAQLPHVAGLITNLQDDLAMVDRMRDALFGEQLRRQELLKRAGNLNSVREYQRLRAAGAALEPLPFLLLVVDEFGELLSSRPDFIQLFVAVGRVGRSLGIHMLLASQQLDEGRLRGLEGHLSYRICLRVFSASESRTVLSVPDAYFLPPVPGSAYFKVDAAAPQRFKVASVSTGAALSVVNRVPPAPTAFAIPAAGSPGPATSAQGLDGSDEASVLEVVVERLRGAGEPVHQVWLPPLERVVTLDNVLPELRPDPERGLTAPGVPGTERLTVPLGIVDKPTEQIKEIMSLDFRGTAGHLAIVGAPLTGKSTLLRALILSFALTHTPVEVQFYCVDFGGGSLQAVQALPHVGSVTGRTDRDRSRRAIEEVVRVLDDRESLFRRQGVDSAESFRRMRAAGQLPEERFGDVFLVLDNWAAVRQDFEDLEPRLADLAARGLGYGVHLVVTANRWMEIRSNVRDNIGGRLELRLNDPIESDLDRRAAQNLPAGVPGRGLNLELRHFQAALPRHDGSRTTAGLSGATDRLVRRIAGSWRGDRTPEVKVLPDRLLLSQLPPGPERETGIPVGVAEPKLEPAYIDLGRGDPHLVVFGDSESGKTNLLRAYLTGLASRRPPERVQVAFIDYRRTLLGAVHSDYILAYAGALSGAMDTVARLYSELQARLPGPDVSYTQLRDRSWWSGAEYYLVVDDYDVVVTPTSNPLLPLLELLPQARDVGLHVLVARRSAGAGRALFEPVLQRLKELGCIGVLLSGDPQEGPLLGTVRPIPQPPGRGLLVRRRERPAVVQIGLVPD